MALEDYLPPDGPSGPVVVSLWERWTTEDDRAWDAFKQFRDATPPRKQRRVIGHGNDAVSKWYNVFRWPERATAYDRHMEKIRQEEREALLRQSEQEIWSEHMSILQSLRHAATREADKLLQVAMDGDGQVTRSVTELVKLVEVVIKMDRLTRGQATENVNHETDLSALSLDDLKQLRALREKMGKSDGTDTKH